MEGMHQDLLLALLCIITLSFIASSRRPKKENKKDYGNTSLFQLYDCLSRKTQVIIKHEQIIYHEEPIYALKLI